MERRASDLHLKVGNYPHLRIDGELVPLTDHSRVSAEDYADDVVQANDVGAANSKNSKETTEIDYGLWRGRPGTLPCERVPAGAQRGAGAARDSHQDPGAR